MDEDKFNNELRKFLKKLGITSQQAIEEAVQAAVAEGRLKCDETLAVEARVTIRALDLEHCVESEIALT